VLLAAIGSRGLKTLSATLARASVAVEKDRLNDFGKT
jgi:hypothetical protein